MDKYVLINLVLQNLEKNAEKYYDKKGLQNSTLEDILYNINNQREVELPSPLPKTADKMIPVLRKHFKDDVTFISAVLNHHFPEQYFFYRVSKLEPEIFEGFEFFSEIVPEFRFSFDRIGKRGFDKYLKLNNSLMAVAKQIWPDLKRPQI
jgi:hypothetical protein